MAGAKRRLNLDGLCAGERRIMALWDDGRSIEKIARELGLRGMHVRRVVYGFAEGDETRQHNRNMAAGSRALLAALRSAA